MEASPKSGSNTSRITPAIELVVFDPDLIKNGGSTVLLWGHSAPQRSNSMDCYQTVMIEKPYLVLQWV
jgi:hypothetical protein